MRFFNVVFPALPVIPIIFAKLLTRVILAKLFKEEKVFFTLISLFDGTFFIFLLTTNFIAPLLYASFAKLCPSIFFPFIAKNILFFLSFFEFIDTPL